MKKINMAICDSGQPYTEKLAEYFISKKGEQLQISTFSKQSTFRRANNEKNFDVVLMGNGFEQRLEKDGTVLFIRLGENKEEAQKEEENPFIFKYQGADEILRKIYGYYQNLKKEEVYTYSGKKEVIGIYSPCHSRLQTPFALTLSQVFSEDKKVLYINLGEWTGFGQWFEENYQRDLSDLLYMISECGTRVQGMLESVLYSMDRIDYIPPMQDSQLLCQTSEEDYQRLLKFLVEDASYDTIFLDFGVMVPGFFSLLNQCSCIYVILDHGKLAQGQREQFEAGIMRSNMTQLAEKMEYISFSISEYMITEREPVMHQWQYGELGDRARVIRGRQQYGGN